MRETFSLRGAPVRALLGIFAGLLVSNCAENFAFADDETIRTISTPSPAHHFGDRGDVVFPLAGVALGGSGLGGLATYSAGPIGFQYDSSSDDSGGRYTQSYFSIEPTADFFVARHLSIGGTVSVAYSNLAYSAPSNATPTLGGLPSSQGELSLGLVPRIGYAFSVGDHVTIWPHIGGGIVASDNTGSDQGPTSIPFQFRGNADLAILYHVDRHFFVSVAPTLFIGGEPKLADVDQSNFLLSFGTDVTLGLVL
ncbi:MAG: hypothetical protein ABI183_12400 [Polyangiaceae bacterium]